MKKFLFSILFSGLLMAQNSLTVVDTSAEPGDTVSVSINLTNSNVIGGIQFSLHFDRSLVTFINIQAGADLPSGFSINYNDTGDSVNIMVISLQGDSITQGSWEILEIVYQVDTSASDGDSTVINATNLVLSSPYGIQIPGTFNSGVLRVFENPRFFITISADTVSPGMCACVPILISDTSDYVGGFQFSVYFNNVKLAFDSVVSALPSSFRLNHSSSHDTLRIMVVSLSGDSLPPGNWLVGYLWFTVQISVLPDDSLGLDIGEIVVSDPSAHQIPAQGYPGYIGVSPETPMITSPPDGSILNSQYVAIYWQSVVGAYWKYIQIALDSGFTNLVDSVWTSDTMYLFVASQDTNYFTRVRPISFRGYHGDWSDIVGFTVDTQSPNTPTLIGPVGGEWITGNPVYFSWTPVSLKSTSVRYIIEIENIVTDTVDSAYYERVMAEGRYRWRVMAFDLAGNQSGWSPIDSFGVDVSPPLIDSVSEIGDTSMFFGPWTVYAWITDSLSGVESAWLFYRYSGVSLDSNMMTGTGGTWSGVIPAFGDSATRTVLYFVKAKDFAGFESLSDTFFFTVTQIGENFSFDKLHLIDIQGKLNGAGIILSVPVEMEITVRCFDVTGRVEKEISRHILPGERRINLRLPAGVHFIEIRHSEGVIRSRFISF